MEYQLGYEMFGTRTGHHHHHDRMNSWMHTLVDVPKSSAKMVVLERIKVEE